MARRNEKERLFRQWIEETLDKQPFLNKEHALNGGAAVIDASPCHDGTLPKKTD